MEQELNDIFNIGIDDVPERCEHHEEPQEEERKVFNLPPAEERYERAWKWYKETMGNPRYFAAPMVGASELAFRMMVRDLGADVCSTPMIDAAGFAYNESYRRQFRFEERDRPLIVQICGNNPTHLVAAGLALQDHCDAIEVNMGCPQYCARSHGYGAFLMEKHDLVREIFCSLSTALRVPVLCKTRIFKTWEQTKELCLLVQGSGVACLTIHGRTRQQKRAATKPADWDVIKRIKELVQIPVVSNGNVLHHEDLDRCLAYTGCDGVMSACGLLADPSLFLAASPRAPRVQMCRSYLEYAEKYAASNGQVGKHVYSILRSLLRRNKELSLIVNSFRYEVDLTVEQLALVTAHSPECAALPFRDDGKRAVHLADVVAVVDLVELGLAGEPGA
mmetsp:Transcript_4543/g.15981  ORF Transcript_4543/g.15981 Transcript_4543/m.15981 type:complete len:391 (+) Transcript_4543:61-1233(+)